MARAVLGYFYLAAVVVIRHAERQANQERKYHKDKIEFNLAHITAETIRDHGGNTKHNTHRTHEADNARNLLFGSVIHMGIVAFGQDLPVPRALHPSCQTDSITVLYWGICHQLAAGYKQHRTMSVAQFQTIVIPLRGQTVRRHLPSGELRPTAALLRFRIMHWHWCQRVRHGHLVRQRI